MNTSETNTVSANTNTSTTETNNTMNTPSTPKPSVTPVASRQFVAVKPSELPQKGPKQPGVGRGKYDRSKVVRDPNNYAFRSFAKDVRQFIMDGVNFSTSNPGDPTMIARLREKYIAEKNQKGIEALDAECAQSRLWTSGTLGRSYIRSYGQVLCEVRRIVNKDSGVVVGGSIRISTLRWKTRDLSTGLESFSKMTGRAAADIERAIFGDPKQGIEPMLLTTEAQQKVDRAGWTVVKAEELIEIAAPKPKGNKKSAKPETAEATPATVAETAAEQAPEVQTVSVQTVEEVPVAPVTEPAEETVPPPAN